MLTVACVQFWRQYANDLSIIFCSRLNTSVEARLKRSFTSACTVGSNSSDFSVTRCKNTLVTDAAPRALFDQI